MFDNLSTPQSSQPQSSTPVQPSQAQSASTQPTPTKPPVESDEEFISVMPNRYKKNKPAPSILSGSASLNVDSQEILTAKKKKNKIITIGAIGLTIVVVFGGLFYFLFWAKNYLQAPKDINTQTNTQTRANLNQSAELKLTADITDLASSQNPQPKIITAEFDFPAGALDQGQTIVLVPEPSTITDNTYQILPRAPEAFKLSVIPALKKAAILTFSYHDSAVDKAWEADIKLAYLKDGVWTPLSAQPDTITNVLTINLDIIPADTFALVVEKNKIQPATNDVQVAPQIFSTVDQDNDGLTDTEEAIYQTNINNPDTDGDGQQDGLEVASLSDPLHTDGTLAMSGLTKVFTNSIWSYTIFYPGNWLVKSLPETDDSQVMVVTNTDEFFEVSVEDNFDRLTPREWYLKKSTDVASDQVADAVVSGQPGVWSPDHLNVYVGKDNKMYILTYNLGLAQEANFKTTFKMMIKSFNFLGNQSAENMPAGKYRGNRPDGSLIKYASSPAIYVIDGGTKRAIPSMDVFNRLEYKQSNINTIPDAEWYPDGQVMQ
ncbi:MAG: hypothetical protein PHV78_00085 [Patescibacteria group bacterium]|nr:hypothetical protein [Patescibacteria group bacterium]MDD5121424.1 hypothetical protein [Patescibacteria group bacterium]MDD5221890.1 hypothetical protein [Patescibacteria group bacterium]MDD5395657.1 hypothetical protein [Patescibacteria group bacterium]